MKAVKKVIGELDRCYSLATLHYKGKDHILVAAEKVDKCMMFSTEGDYEETIWDAPGGVMTMVQVPETDGIFMATHKFYSPNDSKEAKLVIAVPRGKNDWEIRTAAELPFVHRFDIIRKNGVNWLIACTLKSGHDCKDDWSHPGKVWAGILPEDILSINEENPVELKPIYEGMTKNHGYVRCAMQGRDGAVISCEEGIFRFEAPESADGEWMISQLTFEPASDAVLVDLDGDGLEELFAVSPFHGDTAHAYRLENDRYVPCFEYEEKMEFAHAIFGGLMNGVPTVVIGHRKGERKLTAFRYDAEKGYTAEVLDENTGAANVLLYHGESRDILFATNREISEIAMYTFL